MSRRELAVVAALAGVWLAVAWVGAPGRGRRRLARAARAACLATIGLLGERLAAGTAASARRQEDAERRPRAGGRRAMDPPMDRVDEASWESFPASDAPAYGR